MLMRKRLSDGLIEVPRREPIPGPWHRLFSAGFAFSIVVGGTSLRWRRRAGTNDALPAFCGSGGITRLPSASPLWGAAFLPCERRFAKPRNRPWVGRNEKSSHSVSGASGREGSRPQAFRLRGLSRPITRRVEWVPAGVCRFAGALVANPGLRSQEASSGRLLLGNRAGSGNYWWEQRFDM